MIFFLCTTQRNVHPVTGIWQEESNLWPLHQFCKINAIPPCEQWRVKLISEFIFSVSITQNSSVAECPSADIFLIKLLHQMEVLMF